MNKIDEFNKEQYTLIKQYLGVINNLNEAIDYIIKEINEQNTLNLKIYNDCISAFQIINKTNPLLISIFKEFDSDVYEAIISFEDIIPYFDEVLMYQEEGDIDNVIKVLIDDLFPLYFEWAQEVIGEMSEYILIGKNV